jgi:hypothetical protein
VSVSLTPRRMMIYGSIGAAALVWSFMGQSPDETNAAAARTSGIRTELPREGNAALSANAAAFLMRLAHRTSDSKMAGALFATRSWYVAPPPPPPPPPPGPPPPPTAPPLPFTFIGSYAAQGDQATYFLARGDRIYDVKPGGEVDGDYTLVAIDGTSMIFNYKPLNAHQSLAFGEPK